VNRISEIEFEVDDKIYGGSVGGMQHNSVCNPFVQCKMI
jgi:hypothetical protein